MLVRLAMLFGDPVQVKDSILSIPVPQSLQVGGRDMNSTSAYYFGAACEAFVFLLHTPLMYIYICIINLIPLLNSWVFLVIYFFFISYFKIMNQSYNMLYFGAAQFLSSKCYLALHKTSV